MSLIWLRDENIIEMDLYAQDQFIVSECAKLMVTKNIVEMVEKIGGGASAVIESKLQEEIGGKVRKEETLEEKCEEEIVENKREGSIEKRGGEESIEKVGEDKFVENRENVKLEEKIGDEKEVENTRDEKIEER